jgi:hypothetical protein
MIASYIAASVVREPRRDGRGEFRRYPFPSAADSCGVAGFISVPRARAPAEMADCNGHGIDHRFLNAAAFQNQQYARATGLASAKVPNRAASEIG